MERKIRLGEISNTFLEARGAERPSWNMLELKMPQSQRWPIQKHHFLEFLWAATRNYVVPLHFENLDELGIYNAFINTFPALEHPWTPLNSLSLGAECCRNGPQAHPDVPPPLAPLRAFKYTSAGGSRGGLLKLFTRVAGFPNFQNFWAGRLEKNKGILEIIDKEWNCRQTLVYIYMMFLMIIWIMNSLSCLPCRGWKRNGTFDASRMDSVCWTQCFGGNEGLVGTWWQLHT